MQESLFVQGLRNRDPEMFRELVKRYQQALVRVCRGFLHNEENARDMTQEIFVEVVESIHRFRNDSTVSALRDRNGRLGLNLTDEQQEQIVALREENQQEITDLRNDLAIKRAELQKLQSAEDVNRNEVNQKLDEIGQLNTELSKKVFALEQDILEVLTDEQRSAYRSRPGRMFYGPPGRGLNFAPGWGGMQRRSNTTSRMGMNSGKR